MEDSPNIVKPDLPDLVDVLDVLATAVQIAAVELAAIYPQDKDDPEIDSVKVWKDYLLRQAALKQGRMSEEERWAFREEHFGKN